MKEFKAGDLFRFPIDEKEFAFGRIMLNFETQCLKPKKVAKTSLFRDKKGDALVEVYREVSAGDLPDARTVLVPGIITSLGFLNAGMWDIVGNEEVDPTQVTFPEGVSISASNKGSLIRGELKEVFPMGVDRIEEINLFPGTFPCVNFHDLVNFNLGLHDRILRPIDDAIDDFELARIDLGFSEYRNEVFQALGADPDETYYEAALRQGFDLARFY